MKNKSRFMILVCCLTLLAGCDNGGQPPAPAPATAPPATSVTSAATATAPLTSTVANGGLTPTLATTFTPSAVATFTPASCPTVAPPPTLTPVPTPHDYVPGTPQTGLMTETLHFITPCRVVTLYVAVASTPQQWEAGLMGVTNLPQDEGMLFDFGTNDSTESFWMKDTPLPLSIAFVSGSQLVLGTDEMVAFDDKDFISSPSPYRYAIEANADFFTRYGVQVGNKMEIIKP